jgi:hypothetical protein
MSFSPAPHALRRSGHAPNESIERASEARRTKSAMSSMTWSKRGLVVHWTINRTVAEQDASKLCSPKLFCLKLGPGLTRPALF